MRFYVVLTDQGQILGAYHSLSQALLSLRLWEASVNKNNPLHIVGDIQECSFIDERG